ncbi:MAG: hypothetical protein M5U29_14900 [Anaerolineae bacterium]|nr:hypothetical protein [Anaerolineae bacterium]
MSGNPPEDRPAPAEPSRLPPPQRRRRPTPPPSARHLPTTTVMPQFAGEQEAPPSAPPRPQRPSRRRRQRQGYARAALIGMALALPLFLVALLLPPFSLLDAAEIADSVLGSESDAPSGAPPASDQLTLAAESPRIEREGLAVAAAPDALSAPLDVQISALTPTDYLAGRFPARGWHCPADLPPQRALASPIYSLSQGGTPPASLTVSVTALPGVASPDRLALYAWNATAGAWEYLAGGADEAGTVSVELSYLPRCVALLREMGDERRVGLVLGLQDALDADVLAANPAILPGRLRPTLSGALDVVLAPGYATGQGYAVVPYVQNYVDPAAIDTATVRAILENPALRAEHVRQIAAFVLADAGHAGAAVDYRAITPDLRDAYTAFARELATTLHSAGRTLTLIVPVPIPLGVDTWDSAGYDLAALGSTADTLAVLGPLDPTAYAPGADVDRALDWATTQVSRSRLLLSLSALSVEQTADGALAPLDFDAALDYLGDVALEPFGEAAPGQTVTARLAHPAGIAAGWRFDEAAQTPAIVYRNAQGALLRTMWITDAGALAARLARAAEHDLGGVIVGDLLADGAARGLDAVVLAYRLGRPLEAESLALEWRVLSGETIVARGAGQPGQPFTFTAWEQPGPLTVEAWFGQTLIGAETITITLPEPTPTATATETPTPALTAVSTDTPPPATPTSPATATEIAAEAALLPPAMPSSTPRPTAALPDLAALPTVDPAILAAADLGTDFAVGVHTGALSRTLLQAGRMHMKWLALDVRFRVGAMPGAQGDIISQAQGNGFKVLLSVSGDSDEFAALDRAEYLALFTAYLGGLAAYGPDAIEVWREPNALMTPEDYLRVLALSYNAIKTANPNTLVISGALRPLDGDPADSGESDAAYAGQLAALGAVGWADCIGVQYTLGAVSPVSTAGDPRGDNPIYYLPGVTERAFAPFDGARPLCFTRFGYLSAEGLSPFPPDYAWAQNTTLAQQARWLMDAAGWAMADGRVRLLILYSLDASAFAEGSPAAGYALVRPDESCPACETLAPLLEEK